MPLTITSSEAKSRFGELVKWTSANQEQVIVRLYGEPTAVIMSYREYEELELLRKRDQKRKTLDALDALRKEVNRQSSLTVEDAYRTAGFSEEVIRDTLAADEQYTAPSA
jgi:prevent-host-death family protein